MPPSRCSWKAENQRTGLAWKTFMKNEEAQQGMKKAWLPTQHA